MELHNTLKDCWNNGKSVRLRLRDGSEYQGIPGGKPAEDGLWVELHEYSRYTGARDVKVHLIRLADVSAVTVQQ